MQRLEIISQDKLHRMDIRFQYYRVFQNSYSIQDMKLIKTTTKCIGSLLRHLGKGVLTIELINNTNPISYTLIYRKEAE